MSIYICLNKMYNIVKTTTSANNSPVTVTSLSRPVPTIIPLISTNPFQTPHVNPPNYISSHSISDPNAPGRVTEVTLPISSSHPFTDSFVNLHITPPVPSFPENPTNVNKKDATDPITFLNNYPSQFESQIPFTPLSVPSVDPVCKYLQENETRFNPVCSATPLFTTPDIPLPCSAVPVFSSPPEPVSNSDSRLDRIDQTLRVVTQILAHQSRPVPVPPPKFDMNDGLSFTKFIRHFEQFCSYKYPGNVSQWGILLEHYLKGTLLSLYYETRRSNSDYDSIRFELEKWVRSEEQRTKRSDYQKFCQARIKPGEDIRIFAFRLQRLAQKCHSGVDIEQLQGLRDIFCRNLTPPVLTKIQDRMVIYESEHPGEKLPWEQLVSLADAFSQQSVRSIPVPVHSDILPEPETIEIDQLHQSHPVWSIPKPAVRNFFPQQQRSYSSAVKSKPKSKNKSNPPSPKKAYVPSVPVASVQPNVCPHCTKKGHSFENCARAKELCFRCRSPGHWIKDCPQAKQKNKDSAQSLTRWTCPYCTGPHPGFKCSQRPVPSSSPNIPVLSSLGSSRTFFRREEGTQSSPPVQTSLPNQTQINSRQDFA